jgi:hypothetical protein
MDIVAYAFGLAVCYAADKIWVAAEVMAQLRLRDTRLKRRPSSVSFVVTVNPAVR